MRTYHTDILAFFRNGLVILMLSISQFSYGQNTEMGLELGTLNYLGDVVRQYDLSNQTFGGQFFIRKHVNSALSYRVSLGIGSLKGADDQNFDVFSANRIASFEGRVVNSDLLFEYHFIDYRDPKSDLSWSPYILFGAGLYRFTGTDQDGIRYATGLNRESIKIRTPVGVGFKFTLDRRWVLGISTSAIATNSDRIDNINLATTGSKNFRAGNPNDNDWMFFTGVSLSYTFYRIVCPRPFR